MSINHLARSNRQARRGMAKLSAAYSHLCDRQVKNPIDGYVCDADVDAYTVISRAMDRVENGRRSAAFRIRFQRFSVEQTA